MMITSVLWVDFRDGQVKEETLSFPKFSKIMQLEMSNDAQILHYKKVEAVI